MTKSSPSEKSAELSAETRLFVHVYEKIIGREITTFAELAVYIKKLNPPFPVEKVVLKAFQLLKELHWGFFRELDRSAYTRLWKELVIPDEEYRTAGDLKRNISISNIYVGLMDIHGYTRFCQESKSNLSRLRKLDEFLHEGIRKIAASNSALAHRERGDEIVVIAAAATDCLKTTLEIINSFSRKSVFQNRAVRRNRDDYSIILPDFKVTAGIAGGNLTTPLIITESGFLSGYLLNTASRLQSLANELSPRESKVMITQSVHAALQKENTLVKSDLFVNNLLAFFNNGPITFKGLQISSYEIIFRSSERCREQYAAGMEELYGALRQGLWPQKIFLSLAEVIGQACTCLPPFSIEARPPDGESAAETAAEPPCPPVTAGPARLTNQSLALMCSRAAQLYEKEEDYIDAVAVLGRIVDCLEQVPSFDHLLLHYAREIHGRYRLLMAPYQQVLEEEVEKRLDSIFNHPYRLAYQNSRKHSLTYHKLNQHARRSKALDRKKLLWVSLIRENMDRLDLQLYLGKK